MTEQRRVRASWGLAGVVGLVLAGSAVGKLSGAPPVVENFELFHLGAWRVLIGVLELVVAVLFVLPRTRALGTVLVTGYFGGAIVAHLTTQAPALALAPAVLGLVAWGAQLLRNPRWLS
jgi:hypothetical protein